MQQTMSYLDGKLALVRMAACGALAIGAAAAYCELHSIVLGAEPVGWAISIPWALQVCSGWILLGAIALAHVNRLCRFVGTRHYLHVASLVLAGAAALILVEWLICTSLALSGLNGAALALERMAYDRAPITLLALAAAAVVLRVRHRNSTPAAAATAPRASSDSMPSILEVMTGTGRTSVPLASVETFEADENYVRVHTVDRRKFMMRATLKSIEEKIDCRQFVRVHRATIVNKSLVKERRPGWKLLLASGRAVEVSRSYRDRARDCCDKHSLT
jgi:DNA-binding LytR/AlgR family response regulator